MVSVTVDVPEERLSEFYRAVGEILQRVPEEAQSERTVWDVPLAELAVSELLDEEKELLWRIAEARGRRVPMSELAEALGLPATPALEQDFPGLAKFCATLSATGEPPPTMPVLTGGSNANGWYWMSPDDSDTFRRALRAAAAQT